MYLSSVLYLSSEASSERQRTLLYLPGKEHVLVTRDSMICKQLWQVRGPSAAFLRANLVFGLGVMLVKLIGGMNSPSDILLHWMVQLPTVLGSLRPSLARNGGLQLASWISSSALALRQVSSARHWPACNTCTILLQCWSWGTRARPCVLSVIFREDSDPAAAGSRGFVVAHISYQNHPTAGKTGEELPSCRLLF